MLKLISIVAVCWDSLQINVSLPTLLLKSVQGQSNKYKIYKSLDIVRKSAQKSILVKLDPQ